MRPKVPTAREIMTRSLVTVSPTMRVLDAAGLLLKHEISGAPVVDEQGRLVGLFSEYDCLRAVAAAEYDFDHREEVVSVAELMNEPSHTISPELDLFGIAHEFVNRRVRRLPGVEDGNRPTR